MVSNVVKDPTDFHCMNNLLLVLTKTETIIKKSEITIMQNYNLINIALTTTKKKLSTKTYIFYKSKKI